MKVICKLPNASTRINGVAFTARGEVMVSEEISAGAAAAFAEIPGYEILPEVAKKGAKEAAVIAAPIADVPVEG